MSNVHVQQTSTCSYLEQPVSRPSIKELVSSNPTSISVLMLFWPILRPFSIRSPMTSMSCSTAMMYSESVIIHLLLRCPSPSASGFSCFYQSVAFECYWVTEFVVCSGDKVLTKPWRFLVKVLERLRFFQFFNNAVLKLEFKGLVFVT